MPEISRFLGIIIKMFFTDNPPPHLHAVYNEYNGRLNLETLEWLESDLPVRVKKLIIEWTKIPKELLKMWQDFRHNVLIMKTNRNKM